VLDSGGGGPGGSTRREVIEESIMGEFYHSYRALYRSQMCALDNKPNYLECPASCDSATPFSKCSCKVNKLATGETDWMNLLPCITNKNQDSYLKSFSQEFLEDLTKMVATADVMEGLQQLFVSLLTN